jgi:hypothetical protein
MQTAAVPMDLGSVKNETTTLKLWFGLQRSQVRLPSPIIQRMRLVLNMAVQTQSGSDSAIANAFILRRLSIEDRISLEADSRPDSQRNTQIL